MSVSRENVMVFIDPTSGDYSQDRLFQDDPILNRDNCLSPFHELRNYLSAKGIDVHTADYLMNRQFGAQYNIYCSFGMLANYISLAKRKDVILDSFYIMESLTAGQQLYYSLDSLTKYFNRVYIYNTEGIGYERYFKHQHNLHKLFYFQAENGVIEHLWNNTNRKFLTMINSNKMPLPRLQRKIKQNSTDLPIFLCRDRGIEKYELFSERVKALVALQNFGDIDLFGYGWNASLYQVLCNILKGRRFPYPYWRNRKVLRAIYKGPVKSKYETLSQYKFAVCFENIVMPGYITEKIFDCLFVGTIPIYLGAPDIEKFIRKDCFIDMHDFGDYNTLHAYLLNLSDKDISLFKKAAKEYLVSEQYQPFTKKSFVEEFEMNLMVTLKANGVKLM